MQTIKVNITPALERSGLSLAELARRSTVSEKSCLRYKNKNLRMISLDALEKIADTLGVDPRELLTVGGRQSPRVPTPSRVPVPTPTVLPAPRSMPTDTQVLALYDRVEATANGTPFWHLERLSQVDRDTLELMRLAVFRSEVDLESLPPGTRMRWTELHEAICRHVLHS